MKKLKNTGVITTILVISGVIAVVVGAMFLFDPVAMYASVRIDVSEQVSLLSDLRATGGALFASGILIVAGAFLADLTFTAVVVSSLLYSGYGLSRIFAMAIDGKPAEVLVYVAVMEIVIGLVNVFALIKYKER